jgi:hypothetical protein
MLHKCANPHCSTLFRKMNQGRLFQVSPRISHLGGDLRQARKAEYFWLCDPCSLRFTLGVDPNSGVIVRPFPAIGAERPNGESVRSLAGNRKARKGEPRWTV